MLRKHGRIRTMHHQSFIFSFAVAALVFLPGAGRAEDALEPPISCANGLIGGVNCVATKQDEKEAKEAFRRGVKLQQHQRLEEALVQFDEAARRVPRDIQFLTAREVVKAKLVFDHIQRGNALLIEDVREKAAAEFASARQFLEQLRGSR